MTETGAPILKKTTFATILQFLVVQFVAINSYTVAIGYVLADVDATKYFLEFVATPPMYRDNLEIILLLLLRICVHLLIFPETFRSAAYLFCFGLLIIDKVSVVMTTLFKTNNFSLYFRFYRQFLLIYKLMYVPIQLLLYVMLTVAFWFVVFLVWACIKSSPKTISTLVYTWLALLLFCVTIAGFIVLSEFCNTMEIALQTVVIHKLRAKLLYCKRRTKFSKVNYYHARSIYPLKISYGFFGWFGREFVGEFSRVLTLRCFDVIMVF